ncbi:hypothetical protein B0T14DRAFT_517431 [Immersiella caudata]|uniref:Uncharacterized protein n=1 Tax=Immersiella caudata TaxID=314043 RepID=A0AA39WYT2_9PEZI|nr:hypothetical protein B0T14DRAFT_517431 [Immersiella caudata]
MASTGPQRIQVEALAAPVSSQAPRQVQEPFAPSQRDPGVRTPPAIRPLPDDSNQSLKKAAPTPLHPPSQAQEQKHSEYPTSRSPPTLSAPNPHTPPLPSSPSHTSG